jgi:hypothetical protein
MAIATTHRGWIQYAFHLQRVAWLYPHHEPEAV